MAYPGPTKTVPRIQIVERRRKIDDEKKRGEIMFSQRMALLAPHHLNAALYYLNAWNWLTEHIMLVCAMVFNWHLLKA